MVTRWSHLLTRVDGQITAHYAAYVTALALLTVAWFACIATMKVHLYVLGVASNDLFLYANALSNTNFSDRWLFNADFYHSHAMHSLLGDHFQPSTLLLKPLFELLGGAVFLVLFQGVVAINLVTCVHLGLRDLGARTASIFLPLLALINPQVNAAVLDGIYGFHHDSQYLLYGPWMLLFFLRQRYTYFYCVLPLFLGVKENAAFYGLAFGLVGALCFESKTERKHALITAGLAVLYFLFAMDIYPHWAGVKNRHAATGLALLQQLDVHALIDVFLHKWLALFREFNLAVLSPPLLLAPTIDLFTLVTFGKASNRYYIFPIVTFLSMAMIPAYAKLRQLPDRARYWRMLWQLALLCQILVSAVTTPYELSRAYGRLVKTALKYQARDARTALAAVDPGCTVFVARALLKTFYRLPYLYIAADARDARYVVVLEKNATQPVRSDARNFIAASDALSFELLQHIGNLNVYRNPSAACRPWKDVTTSQ